MKIKSIQIENFRSFKKETIELNKYSCIIGYNGAGKSSILAALNVFFQDQTSSATDVNKLTDEDYFYKNIADPIRITVVFDELSQKEIEELHPYIHKNELKITAEAVYDPNLGYGEVKHLGYRMGITSFSTFFDAEKNGSKVSELQNIYEEIRREFLELPAVKNKQDMIDALRKYEEEHPELCQLIPSEDTFYGMNGKGKLTPFIQWVYVPAVKDAIEEGQESKNTALEKLITRAVRTRTNIYEELESLKQETLKKYHELLNKNDSSLSEVSQTLQRRLEEWSHSNVSFDMEWMTADPNKSVVVQQPVVGIKTGEGKFLGSLARMGHGLQRSYLIALLQELASIEASDSQTLILGIEEPELYQHPPQARHLADLLEKLSRGNNQILVTTHSPFFVSGNGFENVRLVRRFESGTKVHSLTYQNLNSRINKAMQENNRKVEGLIAKIHQALQPWITEMFFARVPILVEGLEDVAYITTQLHLSGQWLEFRQLGCHLIPVMGKDKLIQPLAIALELQMPVFIIFDADGNEEKEKNRKRHERDNRTLISLLELSHDPFPSSDVWGENYVIWQSNLTDTVKDDFGSHYQYFTSIARKHYAHEKGLTKNELFIAEWVSLAYKKNIVSSTLQQLCDTIIKFAKKKSTMSS